MKKNNKRYKIIKKLLSDKLSSKDYEKLSKFGFIENQMKKQWSKYKGEEVDLEVGRSIWHKIEQRCERGNMIMTQSVLWWSAACILLTIAIGGMFIRESYSNLETDKYVEVVSNENKLYYLPDSSKVWMQAGSTIRFPEKFEKSRNVWLTGNALFEVRKYAQSKFRVHINKAFIEVKGTSFLVKQNQTDKIILFSGSIEFNAIKSNQKILMRPKQELTYDPEREYAEVKKVENIDWVDGKYNFTNISLKRLVDIINEMYNSEIQLQVEANKKSAFTGSIRYDESLEDVLSKVCFSLNLKNKKQETRVIIYN